MAAKPTPETPASSYHRMALRLDKVAALWGGTQTMRDAGERYLPRFSQETRRQWEARKSRAVLFNYFKKVANSLSGRPFSREIEMKDADPRIEELEDDIDLEGNSLHVFAQRRFIEGLAKGLSHWLIDYPIVEAESAAEELAQAPRPYWVHVPPEALLAAYTGKVEGKFRCIYAKIKCTETVWDGGFGETTTEKVREFVAHQDGYTLVNTYVQVGKNWVTESIAQIDLPYVPLVTFYAGEKEADYVACSPLNDLADKNIEHWQSASDQRHCLTVARFPMLAAKGVAKEEGDVVRVGPNETLFAENPNSLFYFVEHTGQAISAGRQDLEDLKAEMAILAMEMLANRSNRQTATEKVLDAGDAHSVLQMLAINFMDVLNQALVITGAWMKIPEESCGELELNVNFDVTGLDAKAMDALIAAFNSKVIDAKTFLKELYRRGILKELDLDAIPEGLGSLEDQGDPLLGKAKPEDTEGDPNDSGTNQE